MLHCVAVHVLHQLPAVGAEPLLCLGNLLTQAVAMEPFALAK